mgnify:CR=1 FL=1
MRYLFCLFLLIGSGFISKPAYSYELTIIKTVSNSGRTFITRGGKKDGIIIGKRATFTSDNVSVIAKAISISRGFTQGKIESPYTNAPFKREQVVTMYDAKEYLWALSPAEVARKYIKTELWEPRFSLGAHLALSRGLSASVSDAANVPEERGGFIFEGMAEKELNRSWAVAGGLRFSREIINVSSASLNNTQLLALGELRYYFETMKSFYNSRLGLALGLGYGQSQTRTSGQTSSGTAFVLPITKVMLTVPMNRLTDLVMETGFESSRVEEEFEDGNSQTTNASSFKYGVALKRYFD